MSKVHHYFVREYLYIWQEIENKKNRNKKDKMNKERSQRCKDGGKKGASRKQTRKANGTFSVS